MTTEMVTEKVIKAISKVKEIPEADVMVESRLEALNVDSLDAIEVLFELEEELEISIPTEKLQELQTVGDVVAGVEQLLAAKEAGGDAGAPSTQAAPPVEPEAGAEGAQG